MSEMFYGDWFVQVVSRDAAFAERFVITGSDTADGAYNGVLGTNTQVTGDAWTIDLEWNDNVSSGWQPSGVQKSAEYAIDAGLVVMLGGDDNLEELRDFDYNDLVVSCTSLDPSVNPPATDPPLDFSITDENLHASNPEAMPQASTVRRN